eukprot:CAMPEP_0173230108 /NCGR_PEP_ID=MMETSP1142-20121109/7558_1 /TAXON_ID=483371 /ORGANISM="non described non described, Strain CCMP2298" /LENGTH=112 /DNA_ID=CAMNT_0014159143 /DNA_START=272 /DNA_END=610 /DNA_ORIENTATION=+
MSSSPSWRASPDLKSLEVRLEGGLFPAKVKAKVGVLTFSEMCSLSSGSAPRHVSTSGAIPLVRTETGELEEARVAGLNWAPAVKAAHVPVRDRRLLLSQGSYCGSLCPCPCP